MANLLVEIGNTALKAAWADGMTLGKTFRYQGEKMMDYILTLVRKEKPAVMVLIAGTPVMEEYRELLSRECGHLLLLDPHHNELKDKHFLPDYISYDRVASIIAARYLFGGRACTIFDFGTTLTVDVTDNQGIYKGGNISLGCRTRFKALNRYSRSLPQVYIPEETRMYGNGIQSSIESGVVNGIVYEIEGYMRNNSEGVVIFTGGDANYFAKRMKNPIFVICNLVLMGMAIIADEYA